MNGLTTKDRQLIAVCSATGGMGRTILTVNLATALISRYAKISIVDGDLQFGDLAMALNMEPEVTLKDLAELQDIGNIPQYCTTHMSGIELLAAPKRPEYADMIGKELFSATIDTLHASSDLVFVETQAGFNEFSLDVMEKADMILVITTPDMAALKNTRLMIETLDALEYKDKVHLIVNQSTLPSVVKTTEIPNLTKMAVVHNLPYETKHISYSLDVGIPLYRSHPDHEFSKGIEEIAKKLFLTERGRDTKETTTSYSLFTPLRKDKVRARGRRK